MRDPLFPAFAGIACILLLLFLPYQIRGGNLAVLLYVSWLFVAMICQFVNSIAWANTAAIMAPVWGDISTKLMIGAQMGLPASAFAVLRRLERIASTRQVSITAHDQKKEKIVEVSLGIGLPVLYMILHVVIQGHRFDIVEEFGPVPSLYRSWPLLFLYTLPPLLLTLVSLVYAVLTMRWFILRRRQFRAVLQSKSAGLTTNRYLRLFLLCCSEIVLVFPAQIVTAYYTLAPTAFPESSFPLPYVSWDYVHYDFGRIEQVTTEQLQAVNSLDFYVPTQYVRWCLVVGSFFAFFCLGCTQEHLRQIQATYAKYMPTKKGNVRSGKHEASSNPVSVSTTRDVTISSPSEDVESKGESYELYTPSFSAFDGKEVRLSRPVLSRTEGSY